MNCEDCYFFIKDSRINYDFFCYYYGIVFNFTDVENLECSNYLDKGVLKE